MVFFLSLSSLDFVGRGAIVNILQFLKPDKPKKYRSLTHHRTHSNQPTKSNRKYSHFIIWASSLKKVPIETRGTANGVLAHVAHFSRLLSALNANLAANLRRHKILFSTVVIHHHFALIVHGPNSSFPVGNLIVKAFFGPFELWARRCWMHTQNAQIYWNVRQILGIRLARFANIDLLDTLSNAMSVFFIARIQTGFGALGPIASGHFSLFYTPKKCVRLMFGLF
jgi:hypothetical protein